MSYKLAPLAANLFESQKRGEGGMIRMHNIYPWKLVKSQCSLKPKYSVLYMFAAYFLILNVT